MSLLMDLSAWRVSDFRRRLGQVLLFSTSYTLIYSCEYDAHTHTHTHTTLVTRTWERSWHVKNFWGFKSNANRFRTEFNEDWLCFNAFFLVDANGTSFKSICDTMADGLGTLGAEYFFLVRKYFVLAKKADAHLKIYLGSKVSGYLPHLLRVDSEGTFCASWTRRIFLFSVSWLQFCSSWAVLSLLWWRTYLDTHQSDFYPRVLSQYPQMLVSEHCFENLFYCFIR